MTALNRTHDALRRSWVVSANSGDTDFPIQNLPFGVFSHGGGERRVGVAIGDRILDLTALERSGRLRPGGEAAVFDTGVLNPFMALPRRVWSETRAAVADLLDADHGDTKLSLVEMAEAQMHLPFLVRSFTDFYASREHATNVGAMFRDPDNALLPNWLHMPVGYNGRASTVVVSGTPIHRPSGQLKAREEDVPHFGPSRRLDFELELGAVVGTPNAMGQPISLSDAADRIFGYVLLNDWSARDIQVWEYQPLGPFLAKAFGTTIGAWVVTAEALEPFRVPVPDRIVPLLPYLEEGSLNNLDIELEVAIAPASGKKTTVSRTNSRYLYYSAAAQLAHHTSSGCAMETGDLLGSGTISGPNRDSLGSLLELSWNGRDPVPIDGGSRTFLEDGDTVEIIGSCDGPYRIGFGRCTGTILRAKALPS